MVLAHAVPELRGRDSHPLFENTAEIIGVGVAGIHADLLDAQLPLREQPLGRLDPDSGQVLRKVHPRLFLEQLAEIIGADAHGPGHLLQGDIFAEILPDKVTLLAEIAEWPNEIDKNRAEAARARAEERLAHRTEAIDVKRAEFALRKALVRIDIAK